MNGNGNALAHEPEVEGIRPQQRALDAYLINQHDLAGSLPRSGSAYDEDECSSSGRTVSTFTQFLRDYSIQTYPPDFVLKIRKR